MSFFKMRHYFVTHINKSVECVKIEKHDKKMFKIKVW